MSASPSAASNKNLHRKSDAAAQHPAGHADPGVECRIGQDDVAGLGVGVFLGADMDETVVLDAKLWRLQLRGFRSRVLKLRTVALVLPFRGYERAKSAEVWCQDIGSAGTPE